jgi:hypothetical protein
VNDIMPQQLEIGPLQQMGDICFLAGEEVIDANDVVPQID